MTNTSHSGQHPRFYLTLTTPKTPQRDFFALSGFEEGAGHRRRRCVPLIIILTPDATESAHAARSYGVEIASPRASRHVRNDMLEIALAAGETRLLPREPTLAVTEEDARF